MMDNIIAAMQTMPTGIYTIGMMIVAVYWVFVVIGALDVDLISFDGAEVELEVDAEHDLVLNHHGFFNGVLEHLGFGTVPVTIIFSLLTSSGWFVGLSSELFIWPLVSSFMPVVIFASVQFSKFLFVQSLNGITESLIKCISLIILLDVLN